MEKIYVRPTFETFGNKYLTTQDIVETPVKHDLTTVATEEITQDINTETLIVDSVQDPTAS